MSTGESPTRTVRRGYLDLPHGQVHHRSAGTPGDDLLVLLHQVPSSSSMWEAVLEPFAARGYHVVAIDLPGYGASDPVHDTPGVTELREYAEVVTGVISALGADSAFLVGHHTGSSVALTTAVEFPETVRAVAVWAVARLSPEFSKELAEEPPPVHDAAFIEDVAAWWRSRLGEVRPDVVDRVMHRALAEMLANGSHRPDGHNAVGRAGDHGDLLAALTRPVLAMTGGREMLDLETRRAVSDFPDHLELADLGPEAGIDVADESPDLFVDTVDAHFRAHRTPGASR